MRNTIVTIVSTCALAGCGVSAINEQIEVQRSAVLACANERGITPVTLTTVIDGGEVSVLARPSASMTEAAAAAVNACKAQRVASVSTGVPPATVTPVVEPAGASIPVADPRPVGAIRSGLCVEDGGVLQGGSTYCLGEG